MPQKQFLSVYPVGQKSTSSDWGKFGNILTNLAIGCDLFATSWNHSSTPDAAIANATGKSKEQLAAELRLAGIDPDVYFAMLGQSLPDQLTADATDTVNNALADAQLGASDGSQRLWLFAGLGLIMLMGLGYGGRRGMRRAGHAAASRFRAYRKRRHAARAYRSARRRR